MMLDRDGVLRAARVAPAAAGEAERARADKLLEAFVGQGGKRDYRKLEPPKTGPKDRDPKALAALAPALTRAYYRVIEGALMFDREERDRHWAD
jgi:hypothetical protein